MVYACVVMPVAAQVYAGHRPRRVNGGAVSRRGHSPRILFRTFLVSLLRAIWHVRFLRCGGMVVRPVVAAQRPLVARW